MSWLERERPNLTPLIRAAHQQALYRMAWQLTRACSRFLFVAGYGDDLRETHRWGLLAARAAGDETAMAALHNYLAGASLRTGEFQDAVKHVLVAVEIYDKMPDHGLLAAMRANLAAVYGMMDRFPDALAECDRALAAMRHGHDPAVYGVVLGHRTEVLRVSGRLEDALRIGRIHLAPARQTGHMGYIATALGNLGAVRSDLGHCEAARRLLTAALSLKEAAGDRQSAAETMNQLAAVDRKLGRWDEALVGHERALALMWELGDRHGQCLVLNDLAETFRITGDTDSAMALHRRAFRLADRGRYRFRLADAHHGLARCLIQTDPAEARRQWQRAMAIYRELGVAKHHEVAERLRSLPLSSRRPRSGPQAREARTGVVT